MTTTAVLPSLALLGLIGMAPLLGAAAQEAPAADPQQQINHLSTQNAALSQELAALDEQISKEQERPLPEKAALEEAAKNQEVAKAALMETPSVANRQRVEQAKFTYLMAERKHRRANQQLASLTQQRQLLDKRIASNAAQLKELEQKFNEQQTKREEEATKLALQQEKKAEQRRTQQAKKARQKRNAELQKARAQHAAAMAEIERLKKQLAPKAANSKASSTRAKSQRKAAANTTATVAKNPRAQSTGTRKDKSQRTKNKANTQQVANRSDTKPTAAKKGSAAKPTKPALEHAQWIRGGREHYWALLKAADEDSSRRRGSSKLLQVQTYQGDRLLKQTSHSLKHLGNQVYQAKSVVRAGKTEFIIDGKRWRQLIPPSINKDPFVFVLDARSAAKPKLLMFAKGDVE